MIRNLTLQFFILAFGTLSLLGEAPKPEMPEKHRAMLKSHCYECHNAKKQKGKVRLDDLSFTIEDIVTAERWQKILNVLNSNEMPPEDEEQLPPEKKVDFLDDLANTMVDARKLLSDQNGAITMRRLNRREYKNTLRDLLGVQINVSELPSDQGTGGFDTAGQNLFMSATQIEQYQSLGREALEEAFALQAVAGEEQSFRYEPEESNEGLRKQVEEKRDALVRAKKWKEALEKAAAKPENAEIIARLHKEFPKEDQFRREWKQIPGAPAPEEFGFNTVENNADKANSALTYEGNWAGGYIRPYEEYLLALPHQDQGAWLTIMGGVNSNLTLFVPWKWNETLPGDYTVRIRLAHADNAPKERRFIEFGIHPRGAGSLLGTYEVTGTLENPQILEIPLTLTSEHKTRENRQLFIREKGAFDHYTQTRRVFNEAKAKNGFGPEVAIWVDWMEIEKVTDNPKPEPAKFKIHTNRQMAWSSAKGLRKIRYECEESNPMVAAYVDQQNEERKQAQAWVKAVEDAASKPVNVEIVAKLKAEERRKGEWLREWKQIEGAPPPEDYGFQTKENNADKARAALGENWQKYHEYYLTRPALDQGAYLGVQTKHPSVLALDHIQFPVPQSWKSGDYIFRVRVAATNDSEPHQRFLQAGMHPRNGKVLSTFEITGTLEKPQIVEMPFTLTRNQADQGDRTLWIREKGAWEDNYEGGRKRNEAVKKNGIGPVMALWIDWMEIERVSEVAKPMPPGLLAIRVPFDDKEHKLPAGDARSAFINFAKVAFRGKEPSDGYIDRLVKVYESHIESGTKSMEALKDTLSIIMASPMFLYQAEPSVDGEPRQLSDLELASRLSYFLWSAPPDKTLLELAKKKELHKPVVLQEQTTRLLNDPRSREFVDGFLYQWLGMERFEFFEVNRPMYPRFDDSTRLAARNEVYETFDYMLGNNMPLKDLLKSDYIIANRLIADFYGISGVSGDNYTKVKLPENSPRGGLLGMSAIHFMGGNGEHTSPVERGVWVLKKLLNNPPPPAPANVPQIERLAGKVLTTNERLMAHREDPQCASCHRKIDPIGFGMENFDAVGQWRTEDTYQVKDENGKPVKGKSKTWTIEAKAAFHGGPEFNNFFELRDVIASKSEDFARGFSSALIEYALGRPVGFADEPIINQMVSTAKDEGMGTREFIHALIQHEVFSRK